MFTPKFKSEELNQIAEDCGLVIDEHNVKATSEEIEFFVEQVLAKRIYKQLLREQFF